jgi:hypothetical protein
MFKPGSSFFISEPVLAMAKSHAQLDQTKLKKFTLNVKELIVVVPARDILFVLSIDKEGVWFLCNKSRKIAWLPNTQITKFFDEQRISLIAGDF